MQIDIPEEIVRDVQTMLSRQGAPVDVSAFVNHTLKRAVFFETVREVQRQNAVADPHELQDIIDHAVDAVRTEQT